MTAKTIYGPWIKWAGGECPVPPFTLVEVKLRSGNVLGPGLAFGYRLDYFDNHGDIVEYRIVTEQPDLEAAEKLLFAYGYTVTPPAKPLTFEDVAPMTEAPPKGTRYWVVSTVERDGVYSVSFDNDECDHYRIKRRMAYLEREHALIAARHIFGLKGGEL